MINVSINGDIKIFENNITLKEILNILKYDNDCFASAVNTTFVPIKQYELIIIKDGDKIDILSPIQGG